MNSDEILKLLSEMRRSVTVDEAEKTVPPQRGLYAVHISDLAALPAPLQDHQHDVAQVQHVIYIGRARGANGLYQRLVKQDLHNEGPSTFFRGVGSALGCLPPTGSLANRVNKNNYHFTKEDAQEIRTWMRTNLRVSYVPFEADNPILDALEAKLIKRAKPCFNWTHNPEKCTYLERLRKVARDIAAGRVS